MTEEDLLLTLDRRKELAITASVEYEKVQDIFHKLRYRETAFICSTYQGIEVEGLKTHISSFTKTDPVLGDKVVVFGWGSVLRLTGKYREHRSGKWQLFAAVATMGEKGAEHFREVRPLQTYASIVKARFLEVYPELLEALNQRVKESNQRVHDILRDLPEHPSYETPE